MHYGVYFPTFGDFADARLLADLAREAEAAGWDGFFVWDHLALNWLEPIVDATVALAAIATVTSRIRFGPMVTAPARRRPWKLAREIASLDQLSGGRLILGVGLGTFAEEFAPFGEPYDARVRAAKLDEALAIITGLCTGEPFSYGGEHYTVDETTFLPPSLQMPNVPVWGAGSWPLKAPFRRAARWDGVFPLLQNANLEVMMPPSDVRDIVDYVGAHRPSSMPFDVVHLGITRGERQEEDVRTVVPYAEAGVTWWLENMLPELYGWEWGAGPYPVEQMRARVRGGPPPQPDREAAARREVSS